MKKRRTRRRANQKRPLTVLALIMCLAVGSGFLGVKYVVSPWMNSQSAPATASGGSSLEVQSSDPPTREQQAGEEEKGSVQGTESENTGIVEDKIETVVTEAYAVQLGSFSTEEAAKQRVAELSAQEIEASVQQRDNAWKVISKEFRTKEEARSAAVGWRNIIGDAFVVGI